MSFDVFISYSQADRTAAEATCAALEQVGVGCWIAPRDVGPGEYAHNIVRAIGQCRVFLLVFSSATNRSTQVRKEIERAVSKDRMIIPLRVEDAIPVESLEYYLSDVHWLDAFPPPVDAHLQRIAGAVKAALEPDAPRPASHPSPRPAAARSGPGSPVKLAAALAVVVAGVALGWALFGRPTPSPQSTGSVAVAVHTPSRPLSAKSSSSEWKGTYSYPDNKPPVPFDMTLNVMDGRVSGNIREVATFGTGSSGYLYAQVAGRIDGPHITFIKTYDGTDAQYHQVDYDGVISGDGSAISGQYYVPSAGYRGTFSAALQ